MAIMAILKNRHIGEALTNRESLAVLSSCLDFELRHGCEDKRVDELEMAYDKVLGIVNRKR